MAGPRSTLTPARRAIVEQFAALSDFEQSALRTLAHGAKLDIWDYLEREGWGAGHAFSAAPGASGSSSSPQRFAYGVPEIRSADDLQRIADDYAAKENAKNKRGSGPRAVPIKNPDDLAAAAADYAARETAKAQSERSAR
jgi:hypothetical protein